MLAKIHIKSNYMGDKMKYQEKRYFGMDSLVQKVSFGKFEGQKNLIEIFAYEPDYARWMLSEFDFAPGLKPELKIILLDSDSSSRYSKLYQIWYEYNSNKTKKHKVENNNNKKVGLVSKSYNISNTLLEKLENATQNHNIMWIIDFKGNDKVRYCTSYDGYSVSLTSSRILEKETCKKKDRYHLSCEGHGVKIEEGHSRIVELAQLVKQNAVNKESRYKEEERKLLEKYGHASHINCMDFIVRTNLFKCFKNHTVEDIAAEVTVVDRKGNIKYPKVHATYCPNCNKYFIQQSTYNDLKHWGIILHRVITHKEFVSGSYMTDNLSNELADESILHIMGYNVSKSDNLSDEQRWTILECIVDNEIASKSKVIAYLNSFIYRNGSKNNMDEAIGKWECDRNHIQKYKMNLNRWVKMGNIHIHRYDKY